MINALPVSTKNTPHHPHQLPPLIEPLGQPTPSNAHLDTRRYLCIYLPKMPTDRIMRQRFGPKWRQENLSKTINHTNNAHKPISKKPLIVTEKIKNTNQVIYLDEEADYLGLKKGMNLTDAQAAFPFIEVQTQENKKDHLLLKAIADWCERYTPLVAIDKNRPDQFGLILDITGCAHLFGGESALMKDLLMRLFHQGFLANAAITPNPGSGWALCRFKAPHHDDGIKIADQIFYSQDLIPCLSCIPLAGLRLNDALVQNLAKLGIRTIGQLNARPRAPLARRFGNEILYRLDQALGNVEEAISPMRPMPELMAERHFIEPLILETDIESTVSRLATYLGETMQTQEKGARKLDLILYRLDGKTFHLTISTSKPERNPDIILRLFKERFKVFYDEYNVGYGYETIKLCVLTSQTLKYHNTSFLENLDTKPTDQLIDRLAARIGSENIFKGILQDTHLPENAETEISVLDNDKISNSSAPQTYQSYERPVRLLPVPEPVEAIAEIPEGPPIRFRWRKVLHMVTKVEGPERIKDNWWNKSNPRQPRDYYRIEDNSGHRYWLFREGLYNHGSVKPKWFIQGLFA